MCVELRKGRVLVRREDDLSVAALSNIRQVFGVDEYAESAESLLAEKPHFRC